MVSTERFQIPRCEPLFRGRLIIFCRDYIAASSRLSAPAIDFAKGVSQAGTQQSAVSGKAHAHLLKKEPESFATVAKEVLRCDRRTEQVVIVDMEKDFCQTGYTP